ncbi:MAG: lanthionine synthetase C family protein [Waddliaceae bacterium]
MLAKKIQNICFQTAMTLKDTKLVAQTAERAENTFMDGVFSPWDKFSLDYGYPALIIFFSEMDTRFPEQNWDKAYKFLMDDLVKSVEETEYADFSLFSGFAGICFAIQIAAKKDSTYAHIDNIFRFKLMQYVEHHMVEPMEIREKFGKLPFPSEYDAIKGLPGLVFYLLSYQENPDVKELLDRMLRQLVRVTTDISKGTNKIPGWHVDINDPAVQKIFPYPHLENLLRTYPNGFFETGLAHGISGCLAALAKALSCAMEVNGAIEGMHKIVHWLQQSQKKSGNLGFVWPKRLGLNLIDSNLVEVATDDYFDGWAHGAPGILHSMLLAAHALEDRKLTVNCVNEFLKLIERIRNKHTYRGLPFCYGLAGIMAIVHNVRIMTKREEFAEIEQEIAEMIVAQYQYEAPFGFKCIAPSHQIEELLLIDNPGLVTGSIGVLLSLLLVISDHRPTWLSIFFLN